MTEIMNEKMYHTILQLCLNAVEALRKVDSTFTEDNILKITCENKTLHVIWQNGSAKGKAEVEMTDAELIAFATTYCGATISYE